MVINWKNQKVGVWGYGLVGQASARFLKELGADIYLYDGKPIQAPEFHIAQSYEILLNETDYLLPSPGVDITPYFASYQGTWLNELDLFQSYFEKKIVAVTGSVGKTSVTYGLDYVLKHNGVRSIAAGNIGLPCLSIIHDQHELDLAVLEVSSFQLEHAQSFAPDLALWTNFYPNHLDRHKTLENYFLAKCNIVRHQKEGQKSLLPESLRTTLPHLASDYFFFGEQEQSSLIACSVPVNGAIIHHALNLLEVSSGPMAIPSLEHRMEVVGIFKGVTYINDSKATTPASTLQAVESLKNRNILLILGGLSKGIDRKPFIQQLSNFNITIFCFGAEAHAIHALAQEFNISSHAFSDLESTIAHITQEPKPNSVVLFSPSGSSYDLFKNFEHRGSVFKSLVSTVISVQKTQSVDL